MNATIERLESNVRSYCRSFPKTFNRAKGSIITDQSGQDYIDFFAGAGALNYGHNHPALKEAVIRYMEQDGITHGLDLTTEAKCRFLETFSSKILAPRKLDYKVMFPGPTGTNAVESAVKLARKVTGRTNVIAFTRAFHGMTLGSLALTGNGQKRAGGGVDLHDVTRAPFCGYMGDGDTAQYLERLLQDSSSGVDRPAAIILETIQAEGGINEASQSWLRNIQRVARKQGALFIVDDIQVGCGRTGTFFSFEGAGLSPDVVCLSKSLSGFGLPFALTLFKRELDAWSPGEHNGTFRGNNLAFVSAETALRHFWSDGTFSAEVQKKAELVTQRLDRLAGRFGGERRGRGLIQGVEFKSPALAQAVSAASFKKGLIVETSGPHDEVLKVLPPLNIPDELLGRGLDIIEEATFESAQAIKARMTATRQVEA